ncbi:hypothetical protein [Streptomyces sp. VB1]|uniref:hypothetical protein n=1 Tax=Streptomyces sp. VB1 TaxID=2986803 RepID=UPI002241E867|nr:hypothetical protein [Streptomyces sp. VB1]UZI32836.1 hypothetical protein OH133_34735 [Streptomyces sp. VB1]
MKYLVQLRRWLSDLDEVWLSEFLRDFAVEVKQQGGRVHGLPTLGRNGAQRVWASKASESLLRNLTGFALGRATGALCARGFSHEEIEAPGEETLVSMMRALPPELAGLALFGLAFDEREPGNTPALQAWGPCWQAAELPAEPYEEASASAVADEPGEVLLQALAERVDALKESGERTVDALRKAVEDIAVGRETDEELVVRELSAWAAERRTVGRLSARPAGLDRPWGALGGYDDWADLVAEAESRCERTRAELEKARRSAEVYRSQYGAADPEEREILEPLLAMYDKKVTELEQRLKEFGGSADCGARPGNGPGVSAVKPSEGSAPGSGGPEQPEVGEERETVLSGPAADADQGEEDATAPEYTAALGAVFPVAPSDIPESQDSGVEFTLRVDDSTGMPSDGTGRTVGEPPSADEPMSREVATDGGTATGAEAGGTAHAAEPTETTVSNMVEVEDVGKENGADSAPVASGRGEQPGTAEAGAQSAAVGRKDRLPDFGSGGEAVRESVVTPAAAGQHRSMWQAGVGRAPSPVETLLREGNFAGAYWLSVAADEPEECRRALAFAAAAFTLRGEPGRANELQSNREVDLLPDASTHHDAHLVALSATLRTGLEAGWPAGPVTTAMGNPPQLAAPWDRCVQALVKTVAGGAMLRPGELLDGGVGQDAELRTELADRARAEAEALPQRTITLQRGTVVLKALSEPTGPLGTTLAAVIDWAENRCGADRLDYCFNIWFGRTGSPDRLIDETDRKHSSPKQKREKIHSGAREKLRSHIHKVAGLLEEARRIASRLGQTGIRRADDELAQAVTEARAAQPPAGPGGAALKVLLDWVCGIVAPLGAATPVSRPEGLEVDTDCLLAVDGLSWKREKGVDEPDLTPRGTVDLLWSKLLRPDPDAAFETFLKSGDLHLARRLLERRSTEAGTAADLVVATELDRQQRTLDDSTAKWRSHRTSRLAAAREMLDRVRVENLLQPRREALLAARLTDVEVDATLCFAAQFTILTGIVDELGEVLREKTGQLRAELARLECEEMDRERIVELLDQGETVTAEELLSFARKGEKLRDTRSRSGDELAEFLEGVNHQQAPKPSDSGVSARWWAEHYAGDDGLQREVGPALESWDSLADPRDRRNQFQKHVKNVLRLLGLAVAEVGLVDQGGRKDWSVLRLNVRATVTERTAGYVAALGSGAKGVYKVLLIAEEQRGDDGLLRHLGEAAHEAHLVLHLQPLGGSGRRNLLLSALAHSQKAVVVDPAVVGWAAARAPRSFRAVQRVTLPWAAYSPYLPYRPGQVPPEVFKGRHTEQNEVADRDGGVFLYGGRQLGKSSLLRLVAETFAAPGESDGSSEKVALYLDLRNQELGYSKGPEQLWVLLARELKARGVLENKVSDMAGAEVVAEKIARWLRAVPGRRILVLADEADNFLNSDARATASSGGEATFATVVRLHRLMQETERDFKIVYAGLQQVQRFQRLSNTITAHGGRPVLVGPLQPTAAMELVEEPLAALGLFFDTPALVWRILALTNYHPNLIQIFCDGLAGEMRKRPVAQDGSPARITERDVQQVAASPDLRKRIAERLRFTVDLEDRYRVLTLVLALRCLDDGYAHGYTVRELLDAAHHAWPEGFPPTSYDETRVDLDEMEGLGLVIALDGGRYAMRSSNVVNLLGTREELKAELETTDFTQRFDYNPRMARRQLTPGQNGMARVSPLTEEQWHQALAHPISGIVATPALGSGRIGEALAHYLGDSRALHRCDSAAVGEALAVTSRTRNPQVIFADLRTSDATSAAEITERLSEWAGAVGESKDERGGPGGLPRRRAIVLTGPMPYESAAEARQFRPRRWDVTSVRAWPDGPFATTAERRDLIDATGGWPELVEGVMHLVGRGGYTRDQALERVRDAGKQVKRAVDHLEAVGLASADRDALKAWSYFFDERELRERKALCTAQAVAEAADLTTEEAEQLLGRADLLGLIDETLAGPTLDAVTFRALQALVTAEEQR